MKRINGNVQWYANFPKLTLANAYHVLEDSNHVIGCGYYSTDSSAGLFRVMNDGTFKWFFEIKPDTTVTTGAINKC